MKITTATLGMDATTTHKDVQLDTTRRTITRSQGDQDSFTLQIPRVDFNYSSQRLFIESQSMTARSTVTDGADSVHHFLDRNIAVGQVTAEIINQTMIVRDISPISQIKEAETSLLGFTEGMLRQQSGMADAALALESVSCREETLAFSTCGTVRAEDGRIIDLGLELQVTRTEYARETIDLGIIGGRFIDPLVLSFSGGLDTVESGTFMFDLNGDSVSEEIGTLSSGSGYLVLDHNGDGKVNNGLELFGPASGFGYAELAVHDSDTNQWIDENDPIFDELQLWMGAGGEEGRLVSLREAGVGAISLASAEAEFELKAPDGRVLGRVQRAGLFLSEAGEARPMAEIDLAIGEKGDTTPVDRLKLSAGSRASLIELREMLEERRRRTGELAVRWLEQRQERRRTKLLELLFAFKDDHRPFP